MYPVATRQALVVVDAQRGPIRDAWLGAEFAQGLVSLISEARERDLRIVLVQHHCQHLLLGSDDWQFIEGAEPQSGDIVVHKSSPSAFVDTGLHERLTEEGINRLVLCGMCSGGCIQSTLESAVYLGYDVALVDDAHSTGDHEFDDVSITAESLIAWQNMQASHYTYGIGTCTCVGRAQAFDTSISY